MAKSPLDCRFLYNTELTANQDPKVCSEIHEGVSLAVQRLRLRAPTAGGAGWIPGRGAKITHAARHGQKKREKYMKAMDRSLTAVISERHATYALIPQDQQCTLRY